MKKIQIIAIILAILCLNIFSFSQTAEKWIRKPLKFTRSQPTLTVKGTVLAKKLVHCYEFKGKKNQQIRISITSDRNNSRFNLSEQEGDPASYTQGPDGDTYVRSYSDVLPISTIFEICVQSDSERSNYTLTVGLK